MPKVAVLMGSYSDFSILKSAIHILKEFHIEPDVQVMSAHRTPERAAEYAKEAEARGIEVIIAAAGKAAHLPGVLASYTVLPIIGLPIKSSFMDGMDSLLSIAQMPAGIPVATVAINGSENAALLAIQILGIKYPELLDKLKDYRRKMAEGIKKQNDSMQEEVEAL